MKVLLDECVPKRLKRDFSAEHVTSTVAEAGYAGLQNGQLIQAAARDSFDVLVTVDRNLIRQQNIETVPLAIVVLVAKHNKYEFLSPLMPRSLAALRTIRKGEIVQITASP
jgi:predicted nuclease of predicted toxin-antitoxin system